MSLLIDQDSTSKIGLLSALTCIGNDYGPALVGYEQPCRPASIDGSQILKAAGECLLLLGLECSSLRRDVNKSLFVNTVKANCQHPETKHD